MRRPETPKPIIFAPSSGMRQKRSKHGIKTPPQDLHLVEQRLRWAKGDYRKRPRRDE